MYPALATIFDLDGVLTDTAELHYQSWQKLADELGIAWDRRRNEALRGLGRAESLALVLGPRAGEFTPAQRDDLARRKNDEYVARVARMTPADLLPGAERLLRELRAACVPTAVASSSRNARLVIERLGIGPLFDAVVDGNDAPHSKPDPQCFLLAAEWLGAAPRRCVVIEDAESGVAAALAAGMRVIGIGPRERVGAAHRVAASIEGVTLESIRAIAS